VLILDAGLAAAFDRIDQNHLLNRLDVSPRESTSGRRSRTHDMSITPRVTS
jgi:hypothetical protein